MRQREDEDEDTIERDLIRGRAQSEAPRAAEF
jgi:hypothetical protein